jgi:ABC-type transport system involved in multi-copper enzyme maturation permease subunit
MVALLGPIFAKEMVEMARRKRYFINRVFYGLVILFTLFLVWENYQRRLQQNGSIKVMAEMAESFFLAVSGVQFGAVFLFVPLFLCGVIASEREERTLELLFTTQLTDREIIFGKLFSRVAVLVLLIFCVLPVMSLITLFGGVDPDALWRIMACTLMAMLYAGAHAIYFSAVTKSPMGALVRTYWWMAVWLLGVPMAVMIPIETLVRSPNHPLFQICMGVLFFTNPIAPFMTALNGHMYNFIVSLLGYWFFPLAFVAPSLWSLFLIWRAVRRLRLAPTPFARLFGSIPLVRRLRERRRGRPGAAVRRSGGRDRLWSVIPVANPLWLRARRVRVYDREGYIGRIQWAAWFAAAFFIIVLALSEPRALKEDGCAMAFLAFTWIAVAALAAIFTGTSLVGDRRRGFLDLVLITPLEPRAVIDGNWLSVWQHWRRIYWLSWALGLFFCLTGATSPSRVLASITTATLFCSLLLVHGTACSLTARTVPGALVPTFLFPLLVIVGIAFLIPIFEKAAGPVLWVASAAFLAGTWLWVRRRLSTITVACYLMAVHLAFVALATCWTVGRPHHEEYPIAAMNPAFLTIDILQKRMGPWNADRPKWFVLYPCYWAALALNILWARWWLIRHFEKLVERTGSEDRQRGSAARTVTRLDAVCLGDEMSTVLPAAPGTRAQTVEHHATRSPTS